MTHQTHVQHAFVSKAPSSVRKSDAHPPTVSTRSRGNAACPVMVSCQQAFRKSLPDTEDDPQTSYSHVFHAGCMFRGKEYPDGAEFPEDNDPCGVCNCYGGEVVCTKTPCYGDCSHPYKPPGQCCAECERV